MAALQRARSLAHTAGGKLGWAIWRAASWAARSSRSGSVSERSAYWKLSRPAWAPKLAPRSAQASPRSFSSMAASLAAPAATPLALISAAAAARPAWGAGSRREPASKSICTSTMGMAGLCTSQTRAPLASVQCCIGSSAQAFCKQNKAPALTSKARAAIFFIEIFMIRRPGQCMRVPSAGLGAARLAPAASGWGKSVATVSWSSPK